MSEGVFGGVLTSWGFLRSVLLSDVGRVWVLYKGAPSAENLRSTTDTNWESHGGLPSHQALSDPHMFSLNFQIPFRIGCHEILQLRVLINTDNVAFPSLC